MTSTIVNAALVFCAGGAASAAVYHVTESLFLALVVTPVVLAHLALWMGIRP